MFFYIVGTLKMSFFNFFNRYSFLKHKEKLPEMDENYQMFTVYVDVIEFSNTFHTFIIILLFFIGIT